MVSAPVSVSALDLDLVLDVGVVSSICISATAGEAGDSLEGDTERSFRFFAAVNEVEAEGLETLD